MSLENVGYNLYIKPNYLVNIPQFENRDGKTTYQRHQLDRNNQQNGEVSKAAQKKIRQSVNWLFVSAKKKRVYQKSTNKNFYFKLNFLTLTLPTTNHTISDNYFKKDLLHNFFNSCRYSFGLKNYVWKVEAQENGNIHCHITTDTFMNYREVTKVWNKILSKTDVINEFEKKFGHRNPPTTDIKAVKNVKDLRSYICKYLAKNEDGRRKISGRIWGSNYNLSRAMKLKYEGRTEIFMKKGAEIDRIEDWTLNDINKIDLKWDTIWGKENDWGVKRALGEIYYLKENDWKKMPYKIKKLYDHERFKIRNDISPSSFVYEID